MSLVPKAICPVCSPAYTAVLSWLGLGFFATTYLLPLTGGFLAVALAMLLFRASTRRTWEPFWFGMIGAAAVLGGKFWINSPATTYLGVGFLIVASILNAIPTRQIPQFRPSRLPTERGSERS